jgi:glycosyltransferase involved in cell wall biosynthesis
VAVKHLWSFSRQLLFHRLSALVSLTEKDLPKLRKLNPNSFVIPNSVTFFPEIPAQLENKIILAIGRLDYNKGYDLLLDVFERLIITHPDWSLRIVGSGPMNKKIASRVKKAGLEDCVEILSPTELIIEQYLQSSIYLLTSRSEGLPMVLLEAQACGLPIVSFNIETGPSDIITNNKNGYLIDCFNVDIMTEKVAMLCSDIDKRREFGTHGRESIIKFLPEVIDVKWETLFRQIIQ